MNNNVYFEQNQVLIILSRAHNIRVYTFKNPKGEGEILISHRTYTHHLEHRELEVNFYLMIKVIKHFLDF